MIAVSQTRRDLLRAGGALSVLGAGAPLALQLAAASTAAAATAGDYKALVCIFQLGGNDGHNTVLATDADTWGRYSSARSGGITPIALMQAGTAPTPPPASSADMTPANWGGVLPIVPKTPQPIPAGTSATSRTFAVHPYMPEVQSLFATGRLAVMANVGPLLQPVAKAQYSPNSPLLPANLCSHIDQQMFWQAAYAAQGKQGGWGGAAADLLSGLNPANSPYTSISLTGGALFLRGLKTGQYAISSGPLPATTITALQSPTTNGNAPTDPADLSAVIQDTSALSQFANDYAGMVTQSIGSATYVNTAVAASPQVLAPPPYKSPFSGVSSPNPLAAQLQGVAAMIAAAPQMGIRRQVFFVVQEAYDNHNYQNTVHPDLLGQLSQALAYFDAALRNVGGADISAAVTTFTASEFGRTLTSNGTGTDHGWGSHHFVMGGAVKGGDIYGVYPTIGIDSGSFNNPDMVGDYLIPTTAMDQYAATLGAWLGVGPTDLNTIFPNLAKFAPANLGFV